MKPKHLNMLILLFSCLMVPRIQAEPTPPPQSSQNFLSNYWGFSYQLMTIDAPGIAATLPRVPIFSVGHHLDPSLALELQVGLPSTEETLQWNGQTAKQKIHSLLTGRFRKGIMYYAGFETYGAFGITYTSLATAVIQSNQLDTPKKESIDLSYGLGTRFQLGRSRLTGHIEYNRLLTLTNFSMGGINLGINYYF